MDPSLIRITTGCLLAAFAALWIRNLVAVGVSRNVFHAAHESVLVALFSRGPLVSALAGVAASVVAPGWPASAALGLPAGARLAGAPLCVAGLALVAWVFHHLGRNFSTSLAIFASHSLVTDGPYRRTRHPMYTAFCLLFGGFTLLSDSAIVGVASAVGLGTTMLIRIRQEEKMMLDAFGGDYASYMERTRRFVPALRPAVRAPAEGGR